MIYKKRNLSIIDFAITSMVEELGFEFEFSNNTTSVAMLQFNYHVEIYYIRNQFVPNIDLHFRAGSDSDHVEVIKFEELRELIDYMKLRVSIIKGEYLNEG